MSTSTVTDPTASAALQLRKQKEERFRELKERKEKRATSAIPATPATSACSSVTATEVAPEAVPLVPTRAPAEPLVPTRAPAEPPAPAAPREQESTRQQPTIQKATRLVTYLKGIESAELDAKVCAIRGSIKPAIAVISGKDFLHAHRSFPTAQKTHKGEPLPVVPGALLTLNVLRPEVTPASLAKDIADSKISLGALVKVYTHLQQHVKYVNHTTPALQTVDEAELAKVIADAIFAIVRDD
jgi:hypothetical protein